MVTSLPGTARGAPDAAPPPGLLRAALDPVVLARAYATVSGRPVPGGLPPPERLVVLLRFVLFGIVGGLSGVLYVLVYLPLREWSPSAVANFAALAAAAVFNIELNRWWTFAAVPVGRLGMHVRSALLFGLHYAVTTGAVLVLLAANPDVGPVAELVCLLAADLLMSVARFLGLDRWIFRRTS